MDACNAEIEPIAATVLAIDHRPLATWLHLDDGRSVCVSSIPQDLADDMGVAQRTGARLDYIEMCNVVTGCRRVVAWWCESGMTVVALPAGEPTEVRCPRERRMDC